MDAAAFAPPAKGQKPAPQQHNPAAQQQAQARCEAAGTAATSSGARGAAAHGQGLFDFNRMGANPNEIQTKQGTAQRLSAQQLECPGLLDGL